MSTIYYNSIELEWKPTGFSDVLFYIVKYRPYKEEIIDELNADLEQHSVHDDSFTEDENIDNNNHFISINTTNSKLKVGNNMLKPFTFYEFRVVAANLLGLSKETSSLIVRTAATSKSLKVYFLKIKY